MIDGGIYGRFFGSGREVRAHVHDWLDIEILKTHAPVNGIHPMGHRCRGCSAVLNVRVPQNDEDAALYGRLAMRAVSQ
jgi:hypothetical protein